MKLWNFTEQVTHGYDIFDSYEDFQVQDKLSDIKNYGFVRWREADITCAI